MYLMYCINSSIRNIAWILLKFILNTTVIIGLHLRILKSYHLIPFHNMYSLLVGPITTDKLARLASKLKFRREVIFN